jgi:thiosulfate dehydrogenase [quinone] large subunit
MLSAMNLFWHRIANGPRDRQAVAFLRVSIGLFFLYQGYQKLTDPGFLSALPNTLHVWAGGNPFPLYKSFLEHLAIPQAGLFGVLVTYGEILTGISYITGFLVQFSAPAAILMNVHFWLATQHLGTASQGINLTFIIISIVLFWARAGHYYGLDAFVFRSGSPVPADKFKPKASRKLSMAQEFLTKSTDKNSGKKKSKSRSKPF